MRTLYVSDLDGTLLNSNSQIDPESIQIINELVERGMLFTYATARSMVSASVVTKGLSARIPVIAYNGAFIFEPDTGKVLSAERFSAEEQAAIRQLIEAHAVSPIVYSIIDGVERVSWDSTRVNEGMQYYFDHRKGDRRLRPLPDASGLYDGDMFYFSCIGTRAELDALWSEVRDDPRFHSSYQQEIYREEYWLEIMPVNATKYHAILKLKQLWGCDRVVSFGDSGNDLPMFRISDECWAVSNASDSLKKAATGVIGSNDEGSVAHWLKENALFPNVRK